MALDLAALQKELTGGRPIGSVSVDAIGTYLRSPFNLWAELHAPATERQHVSGFDALVRDVSIAHRERIMALHYPDLPLPPSRDHLASFSALLAGMAAGERGFRRFPLLWNGGDLWGEPAVVVRTDTQPSRFGTWSYSVVHLTLARTLRAEHLVPAMTYNMLLSKVQGTLPTHVTLIDGHGASHAIAYAPEVVHKTLTEVRKVINGEPVRPIRGGALAPWDDYCDRLAREAHDVSLVSGVGASAVAQLESLGIKTVGNLAKADIASLKALKRVGETRAKNWVASAQVLQEGKPRRVGPVSLPSEGSVAFLDFESTVALGDSGLGLDEHTVPPIDYLIGLLECTPAQPIGPTSGTFRAFVAHTPQQEGAAFAQFLEWFEHRRRPILIHWGSYEKTRLNRLFDLYAESHPLRERVLASLVNLHDLCKGGWILPTYGYGLKEIGKYLGYRWRDAEVNAMQAVVHYLEYQKNPTEFADLLQKILDYNEDDLRATARVYQWLVQQEQAAAR